MTTSPLWDRVHAHFDADTDPLDDDALVDALAADPDTLAAVVRLRDRLAVLASTPTARRRVRRWPIALPFAAAVLVAAWCAFGSTPGKSDPAIAEVAVQPPQARVVAWQVSTRELFAGDAVVRVRDAIAVQPTGASSATTFAWTAPRQPGPHHPGVVSFVARHLDSRP